MSECVCVYADSQAAERPKNSGLPADRRALPDQTADEWAMLPCGEVLAFRAV